MFYIIHEINIIKPTLAREIVLAHGGKLTLDPTPFGHRIISI
jgi:hypothetical protein